MKYKDNSGDDCRGKDWKEEEEIAPMEGDERRMLLEFPKNQQSPDGSIETDGRFLYVFYQGELLLRLKNMENAALVNVHTYFKNGFIDGAVDGNMYGDKSQ